MITFRPAVRTATPLMLGLAGPSRSGKTFSALRIATGLARGGPIALVDTESGRALQYADRFTFLHAQLEAPFSSERYMQAIADAVAIQPAVIIMDSMSHEHEGPGGLLEQHETELTRLAGQYWEKRKRQTFSAWIRPKAAHNKLVNFLLQVPCHFIFCFRAKDKLKLVTGKEPVHLGWTPICSDRFEYEMTSLLVLPEGSQGTPDLSAIASGLRSPFEEYIKPGVQLDEKLGERLAAWSAGAKTGQRTPPPASTTDTLTAEERRAVVEAAAQGGHEPAIVVDWLLAFGHAKTGTKDIRREVYETVLTRLRNPAPLVPELLKR